MRVVQVCEWVEGAATNCAYVPYQSGLLPDLSVSDALILSSAVWGLLALAWVYKQLQNTVN